MAAEQERSYRVLRPARMDALSDGVHAIAITLLVPDLGIPAVTGEQRLIDALLAPSTHPRRGRLDPKAVA